MALTAFRSTRNMSVTLQSTKTMKATKSCPSICLLLENPACLSIHTYMPKESNKPLYINDMGVISQLMVITEQCVVSSNLAEPVESAKDIGFMYFVDYVLHGECKIGAWEISYKDKEFSVFYTSKGSDEQMHKELLYRALELDQISTFKLVLYIIKKAAESIEEVLPDNFTEETWKLEKNQ